MNYNENTMLEAKVCTTAIQLAKKCGALETTGKFTPMSHVYGMNADSQKEQDNYSILMQWAEEFVAEGLDEKYLDSFFERKINNYRNSTSDDIIKLKEQEDRRRARKENEEKGLCGIRDIQYNQKLSKEEWERLHHIPLRNSGLSARIVSALGRAGYETIGSLADATVEELKQVNRMNESLLAKTLDKLAELKIELPTEAEKKAVLESLTETERLERKVHLLQQMNDRLERENHYQEQRLEERDKYIRVLQHQNYTNARDIVLNQENPVEKIIEGMRYGDFMEAGCNFCDIFKLREKDCLLEYPELKGATLETACETCIGRFLYDYYQNKPQPSKEDDFDEYDFEDYDEVTE